MRTSARFSALFLLVLGLAIGGHTEDIIDARVALRDRAMKTTMHMLNAIHISDPWVAEAGYIDFGDSDYSEVWVGGGYRLHFGPQAFLQIEGLFAQAQGDAAHEARYLQPLFLLRYDPTPRLGGEVLYFLYCPLNDAASQQWVLDRGKLEWAFTPSFKAGAGYGGYQFEDEAWQHKPFVTATITPKSGRYGGLETWLQRLPGNNYQVRLQYEFVVK